MTLVKICGIMEIELALAAAQNGADYLGLVFATSRRKITPAKAVEIVNAVRKLEKPPLIVGIFVNSPADHVNHIAENCELDLVQLSGDESWDYCLEIKKPIIKALQINANSSVEKVLKMAAAGRSILSRSELTFLLDTYSKNVYGGTGQTIDLKIASGVGRRIPVLVAGGLTPANVGELIHQARPWGVDVSSGVETDGKKDARKIRDFIKAVRQAEVA